MIDSAVTYKKLQEILVREFGPEVQIEDESHHHAGHRGNGGGGHFYAEIRSERFRGLAPLARQRLVFSVLGSMMEKEIHALSLKCSAP